MGRTPHSVGVKKSVRRVLRAQWRDLRVLYQESRNSLLGFVALVVGGGLIFHFFYLYPGTDVHPGLDQAMHATFALVFFETLLPFPDHWALQGLFYVIPVLGLAAVADGVLRFGAALLNKQARGQKWQAAMASTFSKHIVVCGVGRVGYRVILELLKFGREVVAIESNPEGPFVERVRELNIPLILGDVRRPENLIKAGIERADAIIPCTDDELTNLDVALDARELVPEIKVVMRMFDPDLAQRVERGFGIHTAFSTSALAAPSFAAAAMRVNVQHSFYVGDVLLNLSEVMLAADSQLIGCTVQQLETEYELSVVLYQGAAGADLHPDPGRCLSGGDRLLVLASLDTLRRLGDLGCCAASPAG